MAVGQAAHAKHGVRIGDAVEGQGVFVADPRLETAKLYKAGKLKMLARGPETATEPPPWHGVAPELPVYRERGHRRLAARTFDTGCTKRDRRGRCRAGGG